LGLIDVEGRRGIMEVVKEFVSVVEKDENLTSIGLLRGHVMGPIGRCFCSPFSNSLSYLYFHYLPILLQLFVETIVVYL